MDIDIPLSPTYVVRASPFSVPGGEVFWIRQRLDHAERLNADDATSLLGDLVYCAPHFDLKANPFHNDLVGAALARYGSLDTVDQFQPPRGRRGLLLVDLIRSYIHVHRDAVWPDASIFESLRRLGFTVALTSGRWRAPAYQKLWRTGTLPGYYCRPEQAPAVEVDELDDIDELDPAEFADEIEQEETQATPFGSWTNPRCARHVSLPYPCWPPRPATAEQLARIARWSPEADLVACYRPALVKLSPASDAHALGRYLSTHDADHLGDWFERHAPLCYLDEADPGLVLTTVLYLEARSPRGEKLAGGLVRLAAKMRRLGYPIPGV